MRYLREVRVLLIGATGQIGYALARNLAQTEHQVKVLVRSTRGLTLPGSIEILQEPEFTPEAFRYALTDADHVIYGVGPPEQFLLDKTLHERLRLGILEPFLSELARSRPRRLTYISTFEVFESKAGVIRESHPIVGDTSRMSDYYRTKVHSLHMVRKSASEHGIRLTTIHPAAVYGGRNTGRGFTDYLENLLRGSFWRVPFVIPGRFPLVHVDSLARAVIESLESPGAYLVSDVMTTLRDIAVTLREQAGSYVPITLPAWAARVSANALEPLARLSGTAPIVSREQVAYFTCGLEPISDKARAELDWHPMPLAEGIRRYLEYRRQMGMS